MRINLTKKNLVNIVYMQIGFSKSISENLKFIVGIQMMIKTQRWIPTI